MRKGGQRIRVGNATWSSVDTSTHIHTHIKMALFIISHGADCAQNITNENLWL